METGYKGNSYLLLDEYNRDNFMQTPHLTATADKPMVKFAYFLNIGWESASYLQMGYQSKEEAFQLLWEGPTSDNKWHYVEFELPVSAGEHFHVVWKAYAKKNIWTQQNAFIGLDFITISEISDHCIRPPQMPFANPWVCENALEEGISTRNHYADGTLCKTTCMDGFDMQGQAAILCEGGVWHDTEEDITFLCYDGQGPEFKDCPTEVALVTPYGWGSMLYTIGTPAISDNTGSYSAKLYVNGELQDGLTTSRELFPGTYEVAIVASDAYENENICAYNITLEVADKTPPEVVSCPPSQSFNSEGPVMATWDDPVFRDDSGYIDKVEASHVSGQMFLWGRHVVEYTAVDNSSNSASCSFTIVVKGVHCSLLEVPDNGATACTESYAGGLCLTMCGPEHDFKVSPGLVVPNDYLCSTGGTWYPYSMTFDCSSSRGDKLALPSSYYYDTPCNETVTQEQLRQQAFAIYGTLDVDITTGEGLSPEDFFISCGPLTK
ncbi:sushi, von Willebrand factor type A, EGF and pentraxin domain-containing protein 1-like [Oratosquilla oratoria]|uniref:sushi, von Willebrand factor type A, EGF and pentraxin domain-containing protein 1-like n=1 Tax=Oratosquilla oratoria TaxID=337810 RepID=UPI003F768621